MDTYNSFSRFAIHSMSVVLFFLVINACGTETETRTEKLFDSGNIAAGESFSYTFQEAGTYDYFCEIHAPDMQGSVTVSATTSSTDPDTVEMINEQFSPGQITVAPNTEIVWINRGNDSHTVISGNPSSGNGDIY